jgi:hypothetical protein
MSWISVDERLPEDGVEVLVYEKIWTGDTRMNIAHYRVGAQMFVTNSYFCKALYWQPLPDPPETGQNQAEDGV